MVELLDLFQNGIAENFTDGRVREDHLDDFGAGEFAGDRHRQTEDHFTAGVADDRGTDEDIIGIEDHLDEAVAAFVFCDVASAEHQRHLDNAEFETFLGGGLFSFTDAGDFRIGVDHRRNGAVVHAVIFTGDNIDGDFAFAVSGMGKHGFAVGITDGIDIGNVGFHLIVGLDRTAFHVKTDVFKSHVGGIGTTADSDEDLVGFEGQLRLYLH